MPTPTLKEKLRQSLSEDGSAANLGEWVQLIISEDIALMDLADLIHEDQKIGMRFSWLIGALVETDPTRVFPAIAYFFKRRNEVFFKGFERSIAKMMYYAGIPKSIEGLATDALFEWLQDPKNNVSTKRFAMLALSKITTKYPELSSELKLVITDQLAHQSADFCKLARKVLSELP